MNTRLHWFNICVNSGKAIGSIQVGYRNKIINIHRLINARKDLGIVDGTIESITYLGYMRPELMKYKGK